MKNKTNEELNERLHDLINKEFIKKLTTEEAEELNYLLEWRDKIKAVFYTEVTQREEDDVLSIMTN